MFADRRDGKTDGKRQDLAADQLLNAVYLVLENIDPTHKLDKETLVEALWKPLSGGGDCKLAVPDVLEVYMKKQVVDLTREPPLEIVSYRL